jgi:ASC-1-like (ASCH) protein
MESILADIKTIDRQLAVIREQYKSEKRHLLNQIKENKKPVEPANGTNKVGKTAVSDEEVLLKRNKDTFERQVRIHNNEYRFISLVC